MKIKYLLTLSFCAAMTNNCSDRQVSPCNKTNQPASAVLAGFSGAARQITEYDANWQEAFKQKSTPLINLFSQFKQAVQANDLERVSKIFKSMNAQFKEMEINDPRYLSFLRDYNNTIGNKYPKCAYSEIDKDICFSNLYHSSDLSPKFIEFRHQRREKFNLGREILDDIYNQAFCERKFYNTWSLYETRNESISEEIANILEHLYCIVNVIQIKNHPTSCDEGEPSTHPRIARFMEGFLDIEKNLHQNTSIDALNKDIQELEHLIPNIVIPCIKNSHIRKRAEKLLAKLRQKVSVLTKTE